MDAIPISYTTWLFQQVGGDVAWTPEKTRPQKTHKKAVFSCSGATLAARHTAAQCCRRPGLGRGFRQAALLHWLLGSGGDAGSVRPPPRAVGGPGGASTAARGQNNCRRVSDIRQTVFLVLRLWAQSRNFADNSERVISNQENTAKTNARARVNGPMGRVSERAEEALTRKGACSPWLTGPGHVGSNSPVTNFGAMGKSAPIAEQRGIGGAKTPAKNPKPRPPNI